MLRARSESKLRVLSFRRACAFQPFSAKPVILTWVVSLRVSLGCRPVLGVVLALPTATRIAKCNESQLHTVSAARCKRANLLHRSTREGLQSSAGLLDALSNLSCRRHRVVSFSICSALTSRETLLFSICSLSFFKLSDKFSHFVLTFDERTVEF